MTQTTIMNFTLGSRLFGLNTPESDIDTMEVYFDPRGVFDDSYRKTVHVEELLFEGSRIELSTFMTLLRKKDQKAHEAMAFDSHSAMTYCHPAFDSEALRTYANSVDLMDMLLKEVNRRYNKTWFKEINPNAKNYNIEQGYDSKFAAHLYRVLEQAIFYVYSSCLATSDIFDRELYLSIKTGEMSKSKVFELTTRKKDNIEYAMNANRFKPRVEEEIPMHLYFNLFGKV